MGGGSDGIDIAGGCSAVEAAPAMRTIPNFQRTAPFFKKLQFDLKNIYYTPEVCTYSKVLSVSVIIIIEASSFQVAFPSLYPWVVVDCAEGSQSFTCILVIITTLSWHCDSHHFPPIAAFKKCAEFHMPVDISWSWSLHRL